MAYPVLQADWRLSIVVKSNIYIADCKIFGPIRVDYIITFLGTSFIALIIDTQVEEMLEF